MMTGCLTIMVPFYFKDKLREAYSGFQGYALTMQVPVDAWGDDAPKEPTIRIDLKRRSHTYSLLDLYDSMSMKEINDDDRLRKILMRHLVFCRRDAVPRDDTLYHHPFLGHVRVRLFQYKMHMVHDEGEGEGSNSPCYVCLEPCPTVLGNCGHRVHAACLRRWAVFHAACGMCRLPIELYKRDYFFVQ